MVTLRDSRLRAQAAEAEREALARQNRDLQQENTRLRGIAQVLGEVSGPVLAQDADAVEWWLALLDQARHLHGRIQPVTAAEIERSAGPHELERLAVMMAGVSTETRSAIQATLERILVSLRGLAAVARMQRQLSVVPQADPVGVPTRTAPR